MAPPPPYESDAPVASVLLVDDNPANLLALEAVLAPLAARLVRATSGTGALEALLREDFAVIVLDVQMPGLDGFETAELIRQRPKTRELPILFATAIAWEEAHVARGYALGAVDYLRKPLHPEVLRAKVGALVDLWRRGESLRRRESALFERERAALLAREQAARAEAADQAALVDALVATAPIGIAFFDRELRFRRVNDALVAMVGLAREAHLGRGVLEVLPAGAETDRIVERLRHVLATGEPASHVEITWRAPSSEGGPRRALASYVPLRVEGRVEGVAVTLVDLTDLVEARERAEAANRSKDEFLGVVSHELRTPLNAILGWAHLLRSGALDAAQRRRALDAVERSARFQAGLVDDILDVSRIAAGTLRLDVGAVDVAPVVEAGVEVVRPAADARGVELAVAVAPDAGRLRGDAARVRQVVWNLASNAVKFTPRGGRVRVWARREGPHVELGVEDTGRGIDAGFVPHLFQPFRQQDASTTRAHGGLGLGLAIVKHIVELHGGAVEARSEGAGRGATFLVRLPAFEGGEAARRAPASALPPAPPTSTRCPPSLSALRVLLVEDDADSRELIRSILEECDAQVTTAATAREALALVRSSPPDVLVSEIALPDADGYSLIRALRELPPEAGGRLPTLALTALARAEDRARALREGFTRYAAKPIAPLHLLAELAALAGHDEART